jgi:hypothetical protein
MVAGHFLLTQGPTLDLATQWAIEWWYQHPQELTEALFRPMGQTVLPLAPSDSYT